MVFGWGTLVQILLASVSALLAEALVLKLRKQSVAATLKDNSALLTGLLLAVSIPPRAMVDGRTGYGVCGDHR